MQRSGLQVVGGWLGILGPITYVAMWAVLGAVREGYDPVSQAISELGEVGAATAPWMAAGFTAFGLAGLVFAVALGRALDDRAVALVAGLCSAMTVAAAAFPCSAGCPGPDAGGTDLGHAVVATVGYAALVATPLLAARVLWPHRRGLAAWSLTAGGVSVVLLVLWAFGTFGAWGGLAQRTFNTIADLWWAGAGAGLVRGTWPSGAD